MDNVSQYLQMLELGGQNPGMQNIGAQQGLQQQNMSALGTLANQALTGQPKNPLQSMADALRNQKKPGVGQMVDAQGNIVPDPTYGTGGSVMANPNFNPYENPV
jgi:hypothetical protein